MRIIDRPWNLDPEIHIQSIGGIDIPWTIREWYFTAISGKFRQVVQDLRLDKANREFFVNGYKDQQVANKHRGHSPLLSYGDMEKVFTHADTGLTLRDAYLKWVADSNKRLHPDFEEGVKNCRDAYSPKGWEKHQLAQDEEPKPRRVARKVST